MKCNQILVSCALSMMLSASIDSCLAMDEKNFNPETNIIEVKISGILTEERKNLLSWQNHDNKQESGENHIKDSQILRIVKEAIRLKSMSLSLKDSAINTFLIHDETPQPTLSVKTHRIAYFILERYIQHILDNGASNFETFKANIAKDIDAIREAHSFYFGGRGESKSLIPTLLSKRENDVVDLIDQIKNEQTKAPVKTEVEEVEETVKVFGKQKTEEVKIDKQEVNTGIVLQQSSAPVTNTLNTVTTTQNTKISGKSKKVATPIKKVTPTAKQPVKVTPPKKNPTVKTLPKKNPAVKTPPKKNPTVKTLPKKNPAVKEAVKAKYKIYLKKKKNKKKDK